MKVLSSSVYDGIDFDFDRIDTFSEKQVHRYTSAMYCTGCKEDQNLSEGVIFFVLVFFESGLRNTVASRVIGVSPVVGVATAAGSFKLLLVRGLKTPACPTAFLEFCGG